MKESRCVALSQFTISLSKIMKELSLETIYMPSNPDELLVCSPDVNRPGLELHGFFTHFEKDRILIIGNAESAYLEEECDKEKRIEVLEALLLVNNKKLTIEITNDDIIAENNGVWLIDNADEPRVREVETDPDYTASLTNWTKVLLGHLTLKQAVQLGFVKENHPVNTDFVKGDVSFYDYF